jgi:hypothetical protein
MDKKTKIKMLVGLDWCQTCALSSRIWKKMKNEKGGLNLTPPNPFYPDPL